MHVQGEQPGTLLRVCAIVRFGPGVVLLCEQPAPPSSIPYTGRAFPDEAFVTD